MATEPRPNPAAGFLAALSAFVHNFAYGVAVALGAYLGWAAGAALLGLL